MAGQTIIANSIKHTTISKVFFILLTILIDITEAPVLMLSSVFIEKH